jgi:hypothetical protein
MAVLFVCSHTEELTGKLPNMPVAKGTTKRMHEKDTVQPDCHSTSREDIDSESDAEAPPVRAKKTPAER